MLITLAHRERLEDPLAPLLVERALKAEGGRNEEQQQRLGEVNLRSAVAARGISRSPSRGETESIRSRETCHGCPRR